VIAAHHHHQISLIKSCHAQLNYKDVVTIKNRKIKIWSGKLPGKLLICKLFCANKHGWMDGWMDSPGGNKALNVILLEERRVHADLTEVYKIIH